MNTKKCISCKPSSNKVASTTKKRANWKEKKGLKTVFPEDKVPSLVNLKLEVPKGANQNIEIDLGSKMKNRMVLYYAAEDAHLENCANCHISGPSESYSSFKNRGIAKLDGSGKGILKMRCPRPYREENKTYLPHVHFIVSDASRKSWIPKLMTQSVVCKLDYSEMDKVVKSGCMMVINSLPFEYYVKSRIPNSVPLDHNLVLGKLSKKEVISYIELMLAHYPKIKKQVDSHKLDIMDVPIVSYCYDDSCEADCDLQMKLNKIGFTNVKLYPGGIIDWNRKHKKK